MTGNGAVPAAGGLPGRGLPADRTSPSACPAPLSEYYDAALLDLDGVVYLGGTPIPGAADALADAARRGMKRAYVTNNASRTPHAIAAQLTAMGVAATAADVVTSAQAAAHLLADRLPPGAAVLVVGGTGLRLAIRDRGLRPVTAAAERPAAVVQGFSPDISYGLLAEAALAIQAGRPVRGLERGRDAADAARAAARQRVAGAGPDSCDREQPGRGRQARAAAARRIGQRVGAVRPLVVGDRLDTDIEGAVRGGADSLLVLTGVTTPADLLLAPPQRRPAYIAADLGGLNVAQPEVAALDGAFCCGGWTAAAAGAEPPATGG